MVSQATSHGHESICSKPVRQFPQIFRGAPCANSMGALRLWCSRSSFVNDLCVKSHRGSPSFMTRVTKAGMTISRLKARNGSVRKRSCWVEALHESPKGELERNSLLGLKFVLKTLKHLALEILCTGNGYNFSRNMIDQMSNEPFAPKNHIDLGSIVYKSVTYQKQGAHW